jgi:hypothetical protein
MKDVKIYLTSGKVIEVQELPDDDIANLRTTNFTGSDNFQCIDAHGSEWIIPRPRISGIEVAKPKK